MKGLYWPTRRSSRPVHLPTEPVAWLVTIGLAFAIVTTALLNAPAVALQHWYLLAVPLILAAFRFGRRGALVVAIPCVAALVVLFQITGHTLTEAARYVETIVLSARSPEELGRVATELADLQVTDRQASFGRALTGLFVAIASALLLGSVVERRNRTTQGLQRAMGLLGGYFSPGIVETITQPGPREIRSVSARREITTIFADLRGFTTLAEGLEPEEIVELLEEFFTAMTEEVFREEGTLDKYIGDGLMAIFGDPVWHRDHGERAARAAIRMQERMGTLIPQWRAQGHQVAGMGIGICTGHCIVGAIGSPSRMDYTAIGSAVNIASRLSGLAEAGKILTTWKSFWRVQHIATGAPRGATEVRGMPYPVDTVEILGLRVVPGTQEPAVSQRLLDVVSQVVDDPVYRAALMRAGREPASDFRLSAKERELAVEVATLCGYVAFQGVPAQEIASLMEHASVKECGAGLVVIKEGHAEDYFYVILQGQVVVTVLDQMGREQHIASLAGGGFFGELSMLFDTPRTATVRTATPARLLVLPRESFYIVLDQAPALRTTIEETARTRMSSAYPVRLPAATAAEGVPA